MLTSIKLALVPLLHSHRIFILDLHENRYRIEVVRMNLSDGVLGVDNEQYIFCFDSVDCNCSGTVV
jgi:hypothetical protein